MAVPKTRRRIVKIHGIVQGVGFRPFIYSLAERYGLAGNVSNTSDGVTIDIEGPEDRLDQFMSAVKSEAPPLSMIESLTWKPERLICHKGFHIDLSHSSASHSALVSPDVATCQDCLGELFSPTDRRYLYPFINCTNCGPRFTITRDIPYDRVSTTMSGFKMCPDCRREYDDPHNRRFHAQPNACPVCGPRVQLVIRNGEKMQYSGSDDLQTAAKLLRDGNILAIKGIGGYHLACDPFNTDAVRNLRSRKARQDKPFALMALDLEMARRLTSAIAPYEETLLTSIERPIVLLERNMDIRLADDVAPRQKTIGVMLAYAPLHHVLLSDFDGPLIMTSGNRLDEPIAYRDEDAFEQLSDIADYFLTHDRPIHMRCDDSVTRCFSTGISFTRRSRGYAPTPLTLGDGFHRPLVATGAHLKNTFCVAKDDHAFLSHHIGDLDNIETLQSFEQGIEHFCKLFDVASTAIACDMHPDYLSTHYAKNRQERDGLSLIEVQHHHAHVASCLADNHIPVGERVIGVAFDGTGYGLDGTAWGGEFFEGSVRDGFVRHGHLENMVLPGGEASIREPWRAAVGQLVSLYGIDQLANKQLAVLDHAGQKNTRVISRMIQAKVNSPLTSSAGRLFDIVAALIGLPGAWKTTYEGQAAIELELAASGNESKLYEIGLSDQNDKSWIVKTNSMLDQIVHDIQNHGDPSEISNRFHSTVAHAIELGCKRIRLDCGATSVALSGGVFQNKLLFEQAVRSLKAAGFMVYTHQCVPANDGGISLGQAVLANQELIRAGSKARLIDSFS